jgi:CMP-N-acetylneuraminic acid synthetase
MKIAIILLARINSRRIPNKLLHGFCGKHLIQWTLELMDSLPFENYVYTDSKEIKKICKKYNVIVKDKKLENKEGVHKTKDELILYNKEIKADIIVLLQGTSPLRRKSIIMKWIDHFLGSDKDCGFSVNVFDKYVYDKEGQLLNQKLRGYDKKIENFVENGSFYIFKKEQLEKMHITQGNKVFYVDRYDIDIDTYEDLERAEILYKHGYYDETWDM